ncbi:MAG: response regulator transcription factor [Chloroflexota bacterium]|nr:MAG: response regulator transcription factor [Chloroflexota bacterium]
MPAIRIVVADDHTLIRRGIVSLLGAEPDMEVVGEAGSGPEAVRQARATTADIVLMDIAMPNGNGLDATRDIGRESPGTRVLILTVHDREDYLFQALRAGAAGYILKGADTQDLLSAIRAVHQGGVYLYPTVTKKVLADYMRRVDSGEDRASYDNLSERERQVLTLIAQGKTTAEIATALFISPHTVQTHRDHIMEKLDLHRKAELIKYAIRKGLIDADT